VTNLEWDHPDVFEDRAAVIAAVEGWIRAAGEGSGTPSGRTPILVANVADPGVADLVTNLADWPGRLIPVALLEGSPGHPSGYARGMAEQYRTAGGQVEGVIIGRVRDAQHDATVVELFGLDELAGSTPVRLATAGRHNAANALGVAGVAYALGVPPATIVEGLATFPGVGRRLERLGETAGVVVYDDYGHHPTAIRETLTAVRQREPGRRIWAVYEPLTYHRTAALLEPFADALAGADAVAIAEIWAGRDTDRTVATAEGLAISVAARAPNIPVESPGSVEQTAAFLADAVRQNDAVLVMGGGRSYQIGRLLLEALARRTDA
jgi:UDP-N-acetylmuramate-alanine ligase